MKKILVLLLVVCLTACSNEKGIIIQKDTTVPKIEIIENPVTIDEGEDLIIGDYFSVSFGESGGNVSISEKKLVVGENQIAINAYGNNNINATEVLTVIVEPKTKDKTAIFFGDSIVAGWLTRGYSWANYLNDNYDFKQCVNAGISDYRLSTYDDPNKWLVSEVEAYVDNDYDYVILQGGVNDVLYDTPLGKIAEDKNPEHFDNNTFAGGLERYLYTVVENWPKAKIGYIITYLTPMYSERGLVWSEDDYNEYYSLQKEILNKWNIPFLDLTDSNYTNLLQVETRTYLPDYLHLNLDGYNLLSPYIYEWMKVLDRYS